MGLTKTYIISAGRIPKYFNQIKDGQAPERLTQQLLRDWGFSSKNDRALIPLLKELKFLSDDGKPLERYNLYRDHSKSRAILGQAVKEAYEDLFLIKSNPSEGDKDAIKGKFKSFHNVSDNTASLMATTFFALLKLADINADENPSLPPELESNPENHSGIQQPIHQTNSGFPAGLHYNIQIHLPATKDIEVYNAIFKSLRVHLVDE